MLYIDYGRPDSCIDNSEKDDVGCDYNTLEQLSYVELVKRVSGYSKGRLTNELKDKSFVQFPLTLLPVRDGLDGRVSAK